MEKRAGLVPAIRLGPANGSSQANPILQTIIYQFLTVASLAHLPGQRTLRVRLTTLTRKQRTTRTSNRKVRRAARPPRAVVRALERLVKLPVPNQRSQIWHLGKTRIGETDHGRKVADEAHRELIGGKGLPNQ